MALNLVRSLRLHSNLATYSVIAQRTIFAPNVLGIESFKKYQERVILENTSNLEAFKKRIEQTLAENKPIFTEDLKTLTYLTRNDADIEMLINALKKYSKQEDKVIEFSFASPLMRLLYLLNKTDLALKLYGDPELAKVFTDSSSLVILSNKLVEEKRYEEAIKLMKSVFEARMKPEASPKYRINSDLQKLFIEALYRINNKAAVEELKPFIKLIDDKKMSRLAACNAILLAINQGETDFAFELLSLLDTNNPLSKNLRVIVLSHMGRFKEALETATNLIDSRDIVGRPAEIFPLTMKTLREKLEKSEDKSFNESFEAFSNKITAANRLASKDLTDVTLAVTNTRVGIRQTTTGNRIRQDYEYNRQGPDGNGSRTGSYGGENRSFGGENRSFGGENRSFGGENRSFGGENRSFGGERRPFGGDRPAFGGDRPAFGGDRPAFGGDRPAFGGDRPAFRGQQGTQNVGGYNRQPFQRGENSGRFDQGGHTSYSSGRFNDRNQQRSPPRKLDNVDDD